MLELLILAFLSPNTEDFVTQYEAQELPRIEILEPSKVPAKAEGKIAPKLLDEPGIAILAQDLGSSKKLYAKADHRAQEIASLTKLMTYLIIRENHELDETFFVAPKATITYGAQIDLYANEQMAVGTLLEAILIPSANDAARALAFFDAGSEEAFVAKMNAKAAELNLKSARFYNATGLDVEVECPEDEPDCIPETKGNKMSAQDLMTLTRILLKDDLFRATISQPNFVGTSADGEFFHEKKSTNQLITSFIGSKGVKTGYTQLAGQCFINLSENDEGDEIITIILGSSDRFGETLNLMSWILDSFDWN